jgi:cytochrome c peroxidase
MKYFTKSLTVTALVSGFLVGCGGSSSSSPAFSTKAQLGEALYSDVNLSNDRTQSCATCHSLENGLADNRDQAGHVSDTPFAGSLGDNGTSLGDRNAPTAGYASLSPEFTTAQTTRQRFNTNSGFRTYTGYLGGQFWDGRESNLVGQAKGPPTNPGEMAMPSRAAVVDRIMENSDYVSAFETLYGADIFNDSAAPSPAAYDAMADSIAAFEETDQFAPFDSKYDRSLQGEYEYSVISKAIEGKALFFSQEFTNCSACHQLASQGSVQEAFTGFEYHNIGVPVNSNLRSINGVQGPDVGLYKHLKDNLNVDDATQKGKFKVPTLRNVAVTAPYMHNGIFNELSTVIEFYQHAKNTAAGNLNPETNTVWGPAEVSENISDTELSSGTKDLTDAGNVEALECFLLSLTDAKFEHLLDAQKVADCGL